MDPEFVAICKRQRAAYEAWQASPEGWSGQAFRDYLAASAEYDNYFKRLLERNRGSEVI